MRYSLKIENKDEVIRSGMQRLSISVMNYCNSNVENNHLLESLRQEAYEAHLTSGLTRLPQLSVNVISTYDIESMFPGPRYSAEKKPWMEKRLGVGFRLFLPTHFNPMYQEFMIDVCLKTLFDEVAFQVRSSLPKLLLQSGIEYRCPVDYKGRKYTLSGIPDYIVRYNADKKAAVKLVIVTAKQPGTDFSLYEWVDVRPPHRSAANFLTVMIHNLRKNQEEVDCVVYGLITDAVGFWFYCISNDGEVGLSASRASDRSIC
ncbi:uncharacterized protein N7498_003447 [Penicillium cinerascens]|uniref:Uncharacterized protein n=1 Tax=Penicillium cinerascens TaxID=70096 RepID=A0A9W9N279_9EURO|nr:uncharacterized protein N7498_003447 [Penicillium cinerascens]KAJ5211801.1 hypothetical protein N7498_003447 [Penicillium cinerascens]